MQAKRGSQAAAQAQRNRDVDRREGLLPSPGLATFRSGARSPALTTSLCSINKVYVACFFSSSSFVCPLVSLSGFVSMALPAVNLGAFTV